MSEIFGWVLDADGNKSLAITAWNPKTILGMPTDLVDQKALDAAIADIPKPDLSVYLTQSALNNYVVKGELPDFSKFAMKADLSTFDPNSVYTKDEVNAAIVRAIGDLQDKIYGGDVNAALDTIKELQDAYSGSNTVIKRLLTQLANKANVGDSYPKKDADARFAAKSDLDNLTIGGRNYALNTASIVANTASSTPITFCQPLGAFANQLVTLSVQIDVDDTQSVASSSDRMGAEFSYTNHSGKTSYFNVWKYLKKGESFHDRISKTTLLDSSLTFDGGEHQLFVQTNVPNAKASLFKIEVGNIDTDWSPAIEDFYSNTDIDTKLATKANAADVTMQLNNKANVGDSYLKKDVDAKLAVIPDTSNLAKQSDLNLIVRYGLSHNYWIVNDQSSGYSLDSTGKPTVLNVDAQTSELIKLDATMQMVFVGWNATRGKQVTVAFYDANKNYISSTIWTVTSDSADSNPHTVIEFYKYVASQAAYVRINCNFGAHAKVMIVSSVFENGPWTPALEDMI